MTALFTRPRRFGKTLALSMLRTFFELEYDGNGAAIPVKQLSITAVQKGYSVEYTGEEIDLEELENNPF